MICLLGLIPGNTTISRGFARAFYSLYPSAPAEEKMYTKPLTGAERVYTVESPSMFSPVAIGMGRVALSFPDKGKTGMEPPASLLKG